MHSPSVKPLPATALARLRKLGMASVFCLGGMAQELRNPLQCQCAPTRTAATWRAPERKKT